MRKESRFITYDSQEHKTAKLAGKHLDIMEANILTTLAARLSQIDKFRATGDYILESLDSFQELLTIRADRELDKEDEEED